jgi:hypothetical protein
MGRVRLRRFVLAAALIVTFGACCATAQALAPTRTTFGTLTFHFMSPCGPVTEVDVGRITFLTFRNPDGTVKRVDVHDPALTATYTLDGTDTSVTLFYSNVIRISTATTQSEDGSTFTEVDQFLGLNYIIRPSEGPPIVSAGRGVFTIAATFDESGNLVKLEFTERLTPHLAHVTDVLCAM